MPVYVFVCEACNNSWEEWFSNYAKAEGMLCDNCGKPEVKKKITTFSLGRTKESSTSDSTFTSTSSSCGSCITRSCSTCK